MYRLIVVITMGFMACDTAPPTSASCTTPGEMTACSCGADDAMGEATCQHTLRFGPCTGCDASPRHGTDLTGGQQNTQGSPQNQVETVPAYRIGTDGRALGLLRFDAIQRDQETRLTLVVRATGQRGITVKNAYLRDFEACDYTKHRRVPPAILPSPLDRRCQLAIVGTSVAPPADGDRCTGTSTCPYSFALDGPVKLETGRDMNLELIYRATQNERPEPTVLVVETDVPGAESLEFTLEVSMGFAAIEVVPAVLSFDAPTPALEPARRTLFVRNDGTAPLVIANIRFEPPEGMAPRTDGQATDFRLAPDQAEPPLTVEASKEELAITVLYEPSDDTPTEAYAVFLSPSPGAEAGQRVRLTSYPVLSHLSISPSPIVFMAGTPNAETATARVKLENSGAAILTIDNIKIEPTDGQFAVTSGLDSPVELAPDQHVAVQLDYRSDAAPPMPSQLVVVTDAANAEDDFLVAQLVPPRRRRPTIRVEPLSIALHNVRSPGMGTAKITVSNPALVPLEIQRIQLKMTDASTGSSQSNVTLSAGEVVPDAPLVLPPDGTHIVEIQIARTAQDRDEIVGLLEVESNGYNGMQTVTIQSNPIR
ncbi:MAG: hypothetical protein VX589_19575 [Myxococcota bacterium]|nr:hypothetical protein [Myxococcota bacterium]